HFTGPPAPSIALGTDIPTGVPPDGWSGRNDRRAHEEEARRNVEGPKARGPYHAKRNHRDPRAPSYQGGQRTRVFSTGGGAAPNRREILNPLVPRGLWRSL